MRLRVDGAMLRRHLAWCAAALLLLLPATAAGQIGSAISGVVRDSSGAVLPGVLVEAASPVLIEGSRSAITGLHAAARVSEAAATGPVPRQWRWPTSCRWRLACPDSRRR